MKCLSVKQPFAELIVTGRKTIELRAWNTSFRGEFLVHASGNPDVDAYRRFGMGLDSLARRAVVGKAVLYDVKRYLTNDELLEDKDKHHAAGKYLDSSYGFMLKDPVKFDKPISMPGQLGFFEVDTKHLGRD